MTSRDILIDIEEPIEGLPDTQRLVLIEDRKTGVPNYSLVMYLYHKPQSTYIRIIRDIGKVGFQHIISGDVTRSYSYDVEPGLKKTYLANEELKELLRIVVETQSSNFKYTNLEQLTVALTGLKSLGLNRVDSEIFENVLSEFEPLH